MAAPRVSRLQQASTFVGRMGRSDFGCVCVGSRDERNILTVSCKYMQTKLPALHEDYGHECIRWFGAGEYFSEWVIGHKLQASPIITSDRTSSTFFHSPRRFQIGENRIACPGGLRVCRVRYRQPWSHNFFIKLQSLF